MGPEILAAVTSLLGVAVGGVISFSAQRATQSQEARRHAADIVEKRRAERLERLIAFIESCQSAERIAKDGDALGRDADGWRERADEALDRMWTRLRTVEMLCTTALSGLAHDFAENVHEAVRQGSREQTVSDLIGPSRRTFLAAAREELGLELPS